MRMRTLVKIGGVLAALMIVLVAGAVIALRSLNLEQVKAVLTDQVHQATGRTLAISGPLELRLGLVPRLAATGITLSNPAGSTRPEMVKIGGFEMEIALLPLLDREIRIDRLVVAAPDILIETEANGPGNLDFRATTPRTVPEVPVAQGQGTPYRFTISEVRITDGLVTWFDRTAKKTETVRIGELNLRPEGSVPRAVQVKLKTSIRDRALDLAGTVGGTEAMRGGKPWPLSLMVHSGDLALNVEGTVANTTALDGIDLKIRAEGGELLEAVRLVGIVVPEQLPVFGPFKATGSLRGKGGRFDFDEIAVETGKRNLLLCSAKGRVADLAGAATVDAALVLASDRPEAVARLAGLDFFGKGTANLTGQLRGNGSTWTMTGVQATLGGSDLSGELNATFAPRRTLSGTFASGVLNISDFAGASAAANQGSPPPAQARDSGGGGRLFPDRPLPVAWMHSLDADFAVKVGRVILERREVADVAVVAHLQTGHLTLKPFRFGLAGGTVEGDAAVDATGKQPMITLRLEGHQIEPSKLDGKFPLSGGRSEVHADLRGSGDSVRGLLASANGEVRVSVGEGRLQNKALDVAGGDLVMQLLSALNPLAKSEDTTLMNCAVVRLLLRDGIATANKGIAMRTSKVDVVGSGTIDLRSERLDLYFKPRARSGVGLSLSSSLAGLVKVGGTLSKPSLGIDTAGTLRTAASVGAGVATGGLSVLGEMLIDKAAVDEDPCRTALGLAQQGQSPQRKESQKQGQGSLLQGIFGR